MKKTTVYIALTLIMVGLLGYLLLENSNTNVSSAIQNSASADSGSNFQKVVLSMQNYNYYPNTVTVKSGQPVRIYLDSSVQGCYRGFTIRSFGIAKYLATPSDYVEFTPTQKGTFQFACSMGMGRGTLIVE